MTIDKEKIAASCDFFGEQNTAANAMEECAELIQCISKEMRGSTDPSHMEEEIGDVLISLPNLIYIYDLDSDRIQCWINFKQNRQLSRARKD